MGVFCSQNQEKVEGKIRCLFYVKKGMFEIAYKNAKCNVLFCLFLCYFKCAFSNKKQSPYFLWTFFWDKKPFARSEFSLDFPFREDHGLIFLGEKLRVFTSRHRTAICCAHVHSSLCARGLAWFKRSNIHGNGNLIWVGMANKSITPLKLMNWLGD